MARLDLLPAPSRPRVDPASVDDADCRELLERFAVAGVHVELYDATGELGIPCYRAGVWSAAVPVPYGGSGAHLCPAVAMCRALTEAAQSRLTAISGSRDDIDRVLYERMSDPHLVAAPVLPPGPVVAFAPEPATATSLTEDLQEVTKRVTAATGYEPIGVELARPGGCLSVVRVVAPGLLAVRGHTYRRGRSGDEPPRTGSADG